ncbi:MAG: ATP synthase F0 subunit B [Ruminococcaceae bacterium]|nr:ATP synthase F0 subunit B [Oscillospiraceae bacterium]
MEMLESLGMSKDLIADLLINIVSIIVLYLVVKKLAYNPVRKFLNARTEKVEAAKAEAQKNLEEATEMKEKYDELLKESENAKAEAIKEGINNARAEATEILDSAREQAKTIVDKANKNAKAKEQELIDSSRDEIVNLAIDASATLLKRDFDDADNKRLIEDFLDSLKSNGDIDA